MYWKLTKDLALREKRIAKIRCREVSFYHHYRAVTYTPWRAMSLNHALYMSRRVESCGARLGRSQFLDAKFTHDNSIVRGFFPMFADVSRPCSNPFKILLKKPSPTNGTRHQDDYVFRLDIFTKKTCSFLKLWDYCSYTTEKWTL